MISSIRLDGSTACMTIEGATDTEVFQTYVREILCPALRTGDTVVMDNLSPHKSDQTLALIEQAGAQVFFLPAYSPDLNPIEKMWSKVKSFLRSAEARTEETLIEAIGLALRTITPQDAINWFAACGYSFIQNALAFLRARPVLCERRLETRRRDGGKTRVHGSSLSASCIHDNSPYGLFKRISCSRSSRRYFNVRNNTRCLPNGLWPLSDVRGRFKCVACLSDKSLRMARSLSQELPCSSPRPLGPSLHLSLPRHPQPKKLRSLFLRARRHQPYRRQRCRRHQ